MSAARERLNGRGHAHDLVGRQFGRLRVLERAENNKWKRAQWRCVCECGNQTVNSGNQLLRGYVRSCGCLRREIVSAAFSKHGMTGTRAYNSYSAARLRCRNPNNINYHHYGGRGIKFLYRSFEEFFADLGPPPPGMTVERCDNHGHYEPGNCRWAPMTEQNNNKRTNVRLTAFGRTRTVARWAKELSIHHQTLRSRLESGWPPEEALTRPIRHRSRNGDLLAVQS